MIGVLDTKKEKMMTRQIGRSWVLGSIVALMLLVAASPAQAQRDFEPLFDKFNVRAEFSWVQLGTEIRLDSEALGRGTTLNFESDLDLAENEAIPTLAFEWQIARKHRLGVRWQNISRDSNSQALTDIQWGDETIPVDAEIGLGFDTNQAYIDYAYYPWVKDNWAAGFGLGLRWLDLQVTLAWSVDGGQIEDQASSDVQGSAPVPYLYFEYRRLFGEHWRLLLAAGWLEVTIEDISGGQYIGRFGAEYLLGRHWAFGVSINLAQIDVEWAGIETAEDGTLLSADLQSNINDVSLHARFRF
jgi:hypothetical protein